MSVVRLARSIEAAGRPGKPHAPRAPVLDRSSGRSLQGPATRGRALQRTVAPTNARDAPVLGRREATPAGDPGVRRLWDALFLSAPALSRVHVAAGALDRRQRARAAAHLRDQSAGAA